MNQHDRLPPHAGPGPPLEVDLLTDGKFRLGAGIGWNRVEYEALGQDFSSRGKRLEEQITVLRQLWTEQAVTFGGSFDRITGARRLCQSDRTRAPRTCRLTPWAPALGPSMTTWPPWPQRPRQPKRSAAKTIT
jgi:hypothetical protein